MAALFFFNKSFALWSGFVALLAATTSTSSVTEPAATAFCALAVGVDSTAPSCDEGNTGSTLALNPPGSAGFDEGEAGFVAGDGIAEGVAHLRTFGFDLHNSSSHCFSHECAIVLMDSMTSLAVNSGEKNLSLIPIRKSPDCIGKGRATLVLTTEAVGGEPDPVPGTV
jgi:hypothetical protein